MLNEQKLNDRMMNLMESGFFGKKILNEGVFAPQVKIKLFQAAYNYTYDKNLAVDGVKGGQTDAAIEAVKKDLGKDKLDDVNIKDFYTKFLTKLDENRANINVGEGGSNTNRNLNLAIQALINIAGQAIPIDGVIGAKTIAAIKALTNDGSGLINKDTITGITGLAVKTNVQGGLGVEGIATIDSKSPEELNSAQNREKIEANYAKSIGDWKNFPCITSDTAYKKMKRDDGTVMYENGGHYLFGNGRGYRVLDKTSYTFTCEKGKLTVKDDKPVSKDATPSSGNNIFFSGMDKIIKILSGYDDKFGTFVVRNTNEGVSIGFYNSYNKYMGSALNPTDTFKTKASKGGFSAKGYFKYKKVEKGPNAGKMALFLSKDKDIYLDEESSYYYVG